MSAASGVTACLDLRLNPAAQGRVSFREGDHVLDQGRSPDVVVAMAVLDAECLGLRRYIEQCLAGGQGDGPVKIAVEKASAPQPERS